MADFLFLGLNRLDIELLNGYNFLVEVSEVGISVVKHLVDQVHLCLGNPLLEDETAHEVAQLRPDLLAVVRLVSGYALVHRILGQKCQILVRVAAVHQPLDLEVGHQSLIPFFRLVIIHLAEALEALRLVHGVWLPRHSSYSLDNVLFLVSEDQNDILYGHECVAQLRLSHLGRRPSAVRL